MKVALIADWLPTFGGAEHVVAEFHALWPDAPLFTTVARKDHLGPLRDAAIRTSPLQRWYQITRQHTWLLPWMPRALERFDLRGYDLIVSSSHAVGKGIIPPSSAVHVCYCHTPMRYAWEMEEEYLHDFRVPHFARKTVKKMLKQLRRWDLTTARRTDVFLANSHATKERIARTYGRESTVVPPPVEDRFFSVPLAGKRREGYYLGIGRLVPYKRFDLLIETANALKLPLKIAGVGKSFASLKRLAGPTVEFLGFVPDEALPTLYAQAKAVLFPQVEDAGVVPLEAQACGTPVIALGQGGVLDTVRDGVTGLFFPEQTRESLSAALARFAERSFDPEAIRSHARAFSSSRFRTQMLATIEDALHRFRRAGSPL
ncbi:MAG: glycosyltransferase [Candidatus Peribacteraceae bacterium]|nr:glycosyltransferase [Candidatus Peribacteraceae bacterium]